MPRQDRPSRGDSKISGDDKRPDNDGSGKNKECDDGGGEGGDEEEIEQWLRDTTNRELVYFLAGVVGIHPGPLTLRKLLLMSNGKERSDWNKFSVLVAKIHNVNCTKEQECIDFKDVHPCYVSDAIAKKNRGPSDEEVAHGMAILKKELS